ncbi:MAG: hypothetical protein OXE57_14475 [Alphaproteobacteria bacterium]|nr:hypothetical protein [Alphaproteobacteria bacterium]
MREQANLTPDRDHARRFPSEGAAEALADHLRGFCVEAEAEEAPFGGAWLVKVDAPTLIVCPVYVCDPS